MELERQECAGSRATPLRFREADAGQECLEAISAGFDVYAAILRQQRYGLFERDRLLTLEFLRVLQADGQLGPHRQRVLFQNLICQHIRKCGCQDGASFGRTSSSFSRSSVAR